MFGTSEAGSPWRGAMSQRLWTLPVFGSTVLVSPLTHNFHAPPPPPLQCVQWDPPALSHLTGTKGIPMVA